MRILVLGCGLMGPAAAFNAMSDPDVTKVTLCDAEKQRLMAARKTLATMAGSEKLSTLLLDVRDPVSTARAMAECDVAVAALPQAVSAFAIRAAASGTPVVDLTRPPEREIPALRERIQAANGLAILGCGVDPGLSEIMARLLAEKLEQVEELHIKCGGFPEKPAPPLGYKIVFGGQQLPLREEDALVVEGGGLRPVPRYSGVEVVTFTGIGELEAYHEGIMPWLLDLPALKGLKVGTQKTVRWPGYAANAALLKEMGFLGHDPMAVGSCRVTPKECLDAVLAPRLRRDAQERDITVLRVEAAGRTGGRLHRLRVEMVDRYDERTGFTSMARVTAFTAAIVARMIGRGEIRARGVRTPEQLITGAPLARLLSELAATGIHFDLNTEKTEPLA